MTTKRKAPARVRVVRAAQPAQPAAEFTISSNLIKWTVGIVGALLSVVVAWFAVWDRIDSHWRLETVQAANDKRIDNDIKSAVQKAEQDTKAMATKAEVGRAWVRSSVIETKAYTASGFARICKALKIPGDECEHQKTEAEQFRVEAADAKRDALNAGKEK